MHVGMFGCLFGSVASQCHFLRARCCPPSILAKTNVEKSLTDHHPARLVRFDTESIHRGAPHPCGARRRRALFVFATCWWNYGVHQEFCAPRILYTKICALLSGDNINVVLLQFTSSLSAQCTKGVEKQQKNQRSRNWPRKSISA